VIRYVATNLTDVHKEPSFLSELLTQVTNGVELEVLKQNGEKWSYVRQKDGYEGWAYAPFLSDTPAPEPTHIVAAPLVGLCAEQDAKTMITRLLAGTRLHVLEEQTRWKRIEIVGGAIRQGWLFSPEILPDRLRSLTQLPLNSSEARRQVIADARKFRGVYYLWGGGSAWGIDCSALAQLTHRLSGYEIPRDCVLQFPVGREIQPPFQAGDLLYFWNEARTKVGHVGISLGEGWKIIHSSRKNNGVYEEDVEQNANLKASYAGARSFLPSVT
jgi:gamma-D-glutamyl-L-lysine dipeptidyl-peptidase